MPQWLEDFSIGLAGVIILIPVAVYMFHWMLRRFHQRRVSGNFLSTAYAKICKSPLALAHFHGLNRIAIAIIIAAIVSKWVI